MHWEPKSTMKKILLLLLVTLVSNYAGAQCSIRGALSPVTGSTYTFSVPSVSAQCADCYYWTATGGASISGSNTGNSVSVVANTAGAYSVSVTYFINGECVSCTKTGTISPAVPPCNFQVGVSSFYIASTNSNPPTVTLQASTTPGFLVGVQYNWMVTYQNGTTAGFSSTTSAMATFTAYQSNPIVSANVIAYYQTCSSTFLRTFPIPIYGGITGGGGFGRPAGAIEKNNKKDFIVYPNPVKSEVIFKGENGSGYSVSIFDLSGKEIISGKVDTVISLDGHNKGIYKYVISGKDGFRQEGTLAKE